MFATFKWKSKQLEYKNFRTVVNDFLSWEIISLTPSAQGGLIALQSKRPHFLEKVSQFLGSTVQRQLYLHAPKRLEGWIQQSRTAIAQFVHELLPLKDLSYHWLIPALRQLEEVSVGFWDGGSPRIVVLESNGRVKFCVDVLEEESEVIVSVMLGESCEFGS